MPPINISDPEFTYDPDDLEGFRAGMLRMGPLVGAKQTGAGLTTTGARAPEPCMRWSRPANDGIEGRNCPT
jgi:hypothetical protein